MNRDKAKNKLLQEIYVCSPMLAGSLRDIYSAISEVEARVKALEDQSDVVALQEIRRLGAVAKSIKAIANRRARRGP